MDQRNEEVFVQEGLQVTHAVIEKAIRHECALPETLICQASIILQLLAEFTGDEGHGL